MTANIPTNIAYRLSYQDGMFLTAALETTEQSYFVRTAALQNALLFTPGVLSGLAVTQSNGNALAVEAGAGFDESGNFLILPGGSGNALTVPTTAPNPSMVYLVYPSPAQQTAGMQPNIVNMAGVLTLAAANGAAPPNSIVLAQIALNAQGQVVSVTDKRVAVTSRLGGPVGGGPAALEATAPTAPPPNTATLSGTVVVPADQLPTSQTPYTVAVTFNGQRTPAFAAAPTVGTQVLGQIPYPTSVSDITTIGFTLTVAASSVTPSSNTQVGAVSVTWWAFV